MDLETIVTIYKWWTEGVKYCYWELERYEKSFTIKDCCCAMELELKTPWKLVWKPIENQAFWHYETILLSPHASKNEKYQI